MLCKKCSSTLDESVYRAWRTILEPDSLPDLWLARLSVSVKSFRHQCAGYTFPHTTR